MPHPVLPLLQSSRRHREPTQLGGGRRGMQAKEGSKEPDHVLLVSCNLCSLRQAQVREAENLSIVQVKGLNCRCFTG